MQHILNGWTLAPIIKLRSGLPFSITNGSVDANLDGNTNDRAQLVAGVDPHLSNPTAVMWFNTAAFVQNKVVTGVAVDRQSPRHLLHRPGISVLQPAALPQVRLSRENQLD